eukprot:EG_transcript_2393
MVLRELLPAGQAAAAPVADVAQAYQTDPGRGLTAVEVDRRRVHHGANEFPEEEKESLLRKYLEQFKEPMILLLLASAAVSLLLQQFDDAISITAAVLIVSTVGFVQTYRSEKSLEELTRLMPPMCRCLRDGATVTLAARELVPGDVVLIHVGDRVPADLRLVECVDLQLDESSFTGETDPVKKGTQPLDCGPTTPLMELRNMAFMGTSVCSGHGKGIVIGTGENSAFGEVVRMMKEEASNPPPSPLQQSLDLLGKQLSFYSLCVIAVITLFGVLQGRKFMEVFTIAVSLAVAAIPEGLPIVVTVTLALGVLRMSRQHVIVKRLPAVETLGCVTTVCSDKTGTLTQNQQTVTLVRASTGDEVRLTGVGYAEEGAVLAEGVPIVPAAAGNVRRVLEIGVLCNNAAFSPTGELLGSSTEGAILVAAHKFGLDGLRAQYDRVHETPFNAEQKLMAVQAHRKGTAPADALHYVKGAPEAVLGLCGRYLLDTPARPVSLAAADRQRFLAQAADMAAQGLRVLGVAVGAELGELQFAGLIGMQDPLRHGVKEAISVLQGSGISIKMITGDARETAVSVARSLGICQINGKGEVEVISGEQIETMGAQELERRIKHVSVFYRTTPRHKLQIVQALQRAGEVVGMTGDGVNDAISLRRADIGIAMGRSGTDVCKEAADMVLVLDDFSTIVSAMEEGKAIFYNICNFIRFQLSTSVAALSLIALSTLLNFPNPLNAMQILWINILMDGPPAQSLGVEPVDQDVMRRPPRLVSAPIITVSLVSKVLLSATMIVCGTLWIFWREMQDDKITPRDTTMTFTCFVFFDLFNALASRSQTKTVFEIGLFSNAAFLYAVGGSLLGQVLVVYLPPLQRVFQTEALAAQDLLLLLGLASSVWLVDDARKLIARRSLGRAPVPTERLDKSARV